MPKVLHRMKKGYGKHYHRDENGRMVLLRPGDSILVDPEILAGARDKFEIVGPTPPPPVSVIGLVISEIGDGMWNVLNIETKRPINDRPLTLDEAKSITEHTEYEGA